MHGPLIPHDDPMMRMLVALVQERLPDSTHHDRIRLLAQLRGLEQDAVKGRAEPNTLRSIRATQGFMDRCDRQIGLIAPS